MSKTIDILVINQNDWWSVICKELKISGFGESEEDAILAFERSLASTLAARLRVAVEIKEDTQCLNADVFRRVQDDSCTGRLVKRIPLTQALGT